MFNRKGHDFKIDVWSIGILSYELCNGKPPFESETYNETMKKVCRDQIHYPKFFSTELKYMLSKLLTKDPHKRPNLKDILDF